MSNLNNLNTLSEKELAVVTGGSLSTSPTVTWPIIVPFGDPSDWDQGLYV